MSSNIQLGNHEWLHQVDLISTVCKFASESADTHCLRKLAEFSDMKPLEVYKVLQNQIAWKKILRITCHDGEPGELARQIVDTCMASVSENKMGDDMFTTKTIEDEDNHPVPIQVSARPEIRDWFLTDESLQKTRLSTSIFDTLNKSNNENENDYNTNSNCTSESENDCKSEPDLLQFEMNVICASSKEKRENTIPSIMWPCSHLLSQIILSCPELVRGKRVLELGAGFHAVPAAACVKAGCDKIRVTEIDKMSMNLMTQNLVANNIGGTIEVSRLDWTNLDPDDHHKQLQKYIPRKLLQNKFDVIIGADIIHEKWMACAIEETITKYLKPDGIVLIVNGSQESRFGMEKWQEQMSYDSYLVRGIVLDAPPQHHEGVVGIEKVNAQKPMDEWCMKLTYTICTHAERFVNLTTT